MIFLTEEGMKEIYEDSSCDILGRGKLNVINVNVLDIHSLYMNKLSALSIERTGALCVSPADFSYLSILWTLSMVFCEKNEVLHGILRLRPSEQFCLRVIEITIYLKAEELEAEANYVTNMARGNLKYIEDGKRNNRWPSVSA